MARLRALRIVFIFILLLIGLSGNKCDNSDSSGSQIPDEIRQIFDKPLYQDAAWGLRVVDLETGEVIYNLRPDFDFFIGSVRKLFSVGLGTSFDCFRRIDSPSFCAVEIFSPLQTEGAIVRRLEKEF